MRNVLFAAWVLCLSLALWGCNGDDNSVTFDGGRQSDATVPDGGAQLVGDGGTGPAQTFTVGGTASGLVGTGLILKNGTETLPITANGAFSFKTGLNRGAAYAVSVSAQPSSPAQACSVAKGTGTIASANLTSVVVTCSTMTFNVGGSVSGLVGAGLVLQNNGGDDLAVTASGAFTFATAVTSGNAFHVTVKTQPGSPSQACTVTGGTGMVGGASVTSVLVDCDTSKFAVGGVITGLGGAVVLQDNGGDSLTVTSNGSFAFATPLVSGGTYAVTVLTQPGAPSQVCTATSASGVVASAAVTAVRIACVTNKYNVGGTVAGLVGAGLVLQDNGGDSLAVAADGVVSFAKSVSSGATYAVTVLTQPTLPSQTCVVTGGTGTMGAANVANVAIACTTTLDKVGGTVTGLAGTGLVLQNNTGDDLAVAADGAFTFATSIASGSLFAVTVSAQPGLPTQACTVSGGTGTVGAGPITSVTVNCATNVYAVSGSVSGLAGGAILQDNGGDNLTLTANGSFAFATPIASASTYAVTVVTQPGKPSQTCSVTNGSGTVVSSIVSNVTVVCVTNAFAVTGTVSGLSGAGLVLQDNGGDSLPIAANGSFKFATTVLSGAPYAVTVLTQPTVLSQTCVVTNDTGVVGGADVNGVAIACATNTYNIGGTITGLAGLGLVLQDNGGDNFTSSSDGTFQFATQVASGGAYAVTVLQQPLTPSQTCVVTLDAGAVVAADVPGVVVTCTTNAYAVGGSVSGLLGVGLVLTDNGGDPLTITANGAFQFATAVASSSPFSVAVLTQPSVPSQSCTVMANSGAVGGGAVTTVAVNCATNTYTIGGTVSGLAGASVVLQDNGGDDLAVASNGSFAFATPIASGAAYAVTVLTQPGLPSQTCTLGSDSGIVGGMSVSGVTVTCLTNSFNVGGTISGLVPGGTVVLRDNLADELTVAANGTFVFPTPVASASPYSVDVLTPPSSPTQTCLVTAGSGIVGSADVTTVSVTCTTNTYTIGGMLTLGGGGTIVLQDNAGDDLTLTASGPFTFPTGVLSGGAYAVTVLTAPTNPTPPVNQTCTVTNGSGTVGGANVIDVTVSCFASCRIVNGINWCYDPNNCGQACAQLCSTLGLPLSISDATWFNAQNTPAQCQAIASAFGIASTDVESYTYACVEDTGGSSNSLSNFLLCSNYSGCPNQHRTNMDQIGSTCAQGGRHSVCPCQTEPTPI